MHHVEMLNHAKNSCYMLEDTSCNLYLYVFSLIGDDQGPLRAEIAVLPYPSGLSSHAQEYPSFDQIMENCRDLQDKLHGAMDLAAAIQHPFYEFEHVGSFMSFPAHCLILLSFLVYSAKGAQFTVPCKILCCIWWHLLILSHLFLSLSLLPLQVT